MVCHSLSYVYACKPTGQVPHAPGRFKSPVGGGQHTICNMHILYCKMMGSAGKSWVLCEGPHCNGELWWGRGFTNLEISDRIQRSWGSAHGAKKLKRFSTN